MLKFGEVYTENVNFIFQKKRLLQMIFMLKI